MHIHGRITCIGVFLALFTCPYGLSVRKVNVLDLSTKQIPYRRALGWQQSLVEEQILLKDASRQGTTENDLAFGTVGTILLLQHDPVYTLGTGSTPDGGPFSNVCSRGNPLHYETINVDRAGEATYHGPGQLVLYPVLDLAHFGNDINWYLRSLEETVIRAARELGITAGRIEQPGYTGVWVGTSKVAAIGVKIRRWVTMHGVSVNVEPDMRYFGNIVPCGIADADKSVGTLRQFNSQATLPVVAEVLLHKFTEVFGVQENERRSGVDAETFLDTLSSSKPDDFR